ncbi:MAG TPA: VgrG-related protein [Kutzneria sp.]|jgi:uncharacterized protein involved in type VI secretion and phage assembly|nr:VgrG-related protein [Kutzneria sp.]
MTAPGRSFAADPRVFAPDLLSPTWHRQLVHTVVEESQGRPDAATLAFRDPYHKLTTDTGIAIGDPFKVSVVVPESTSTATLFVGEVTALDLEIDNTGSFTVVRALGRAHRLQRGRRVEAFRDMSADAIVRKVAKNARLDVGRIDVPKVIYHQLSQAGVSDWDFLQDLAAQLGVVVRVDEEDKLDFAPPRPTGTPVEVKHGKEVLALRATRTSADDVDAVQVRSWDVAAREAFVATVPTKAGGTKAFGAATALVVDTPYGSDAETNVAARALSESLRAGRFELEAVIAGEPRLQVGVKVKLTDFGPEFDGLHTATAVRHTIDPDGGYRTTAVVGATPDRSLGGLTAGVGPRARGPRFPGVATGIVTAVGDPNDKQRGWVKLKFPWLDDKYETNWVRTVQLGSQGGGVFGWDVNDEVLVAFEHGCLDLPYVVGGLYNGRNLPSAHDLPLVNGTGSVNRRSLVSRKGHRLELIDGVAGPPGVRVATGDSALEFRLDAARDTITVRVAGGGEISMGKQGVTVDAGAGRLELKGASVSVTGQTGVTVDGGLEAVLRGDFVRIN